MTRSFWPYYLGNHVYYLFLTNRVLKEETKLFFPVFFFSFKASLLFLKNCCTKAFYVSRVLEIGEKNLHSRLALPDLFFFFTNVRMLMVTLSLLNAQVLNFNILYVHLYISASFSLQVKEECKNSCLRSCGILQPKNNLKIY